MLTRLISAAAAQSQCTSAARLSLRFLSVSAPRLGDGDHTKSKAKEKAAADLKSGKEKRWLDTVASDSGKCDEEQAVASNERTSSAAYRGHSQK